MNEPKLQYIPLAGERVVLKRGVNELLLSGPGVQTLVEPLVELINGGRPAAELAAAFPPAARAEVEELIESLRQRRLLSDDGDGEGDGHEALAAGFFWHFGDAGRRAPERLRQASVLVVGVNAISRALVRSLLGSGLGGVTLAHHPLLDNRLLAAESPTDGRRLREIDGLPAAADKYALICATCDFGQPEALVEINRGALAARVPFLPVWISDLIGFIGPLNYPFETACLSCLRARSDANSPDYEAARAIRSHLDRHGDAFSGAGLLPPMPGVVGEIAAMEVIKGVGGFTSSDTVSRLIEINLVSFGSAVRRVLKLPRCPECSEMMRQPTRTLTLLPQIPRSNSG